MIPARVGCPQTQRFATDCRSFQKRSARRIAAFFGKIKDMEAVFADPILESAASRAHP
jgi:hypothetical protein